MRPLLPSLRWYILALANASDRRRRLLNQRRRKSRITSMMRCLHIILNIPEPEFMNIFRLGKDEVKFLLDQLSPYLRQLRRKDSISPHLKILIALAFYASGSYQTLVGCNALYNISQPSVSRAVREVTQALNHPDIIGHHIVWPVDTQERNNIMAKFSRLGVPGVLGCVDSTHVAILRPKMDEKIYYNMKGYHSLNVMIICDADLNILSVDANCPGSIHKSSVWENNCIYNNLKELNNAGNQVFLLGDKEYPLSSAIMTPLSNTMEGTPEYHYNHLHASTYKIVENCINTLKARFRCLLAAKALHYDPNTAGKIVIACCVLYNIANKNRLNFTPLTIKDLQLERQRQQHQSKSELNILSDSHQKYFENKGSTDLQEGRALQEALINKLWTNRNK